MTDLRRLAPFALLTSALALAPWSILILSGQDAYAMPGFALFALGACSPSVAGIALAYRRRPQDARDLLRAAVAVRLSPGLIAVLSVVVVGGLVGVAIDHLLATAPAHPAPDGAAGVVAALALATLMGPFNEELGWVGYATRAGSTPGLRRRAISVAVLRLAWHLPMFAMVGTDQAGSSIVPFAVAILSLQAFATAGALQSGLFGAVVVHAVFNATIAIFPLGAGGYVARALLYGGAGLVIATASPRRRLRSSLPDALGPSNLASVSGRSANLQ